MPHHIDRRVGRLVEYPLIGEMTAEEMRQFRTRVRATLGGWSILFADPRKLLALSLDVMQGLLTMATHATSKVERVAVTCAPAPQLLSTQIVKTMSAAIELAKSMRNQSDRRGLTDIVEAGRWLDQLLHAPERARLAELVAA